MTHRAESILDAAAAALGSLATTGDRVYRARAWKTAERPALIIFKGSDLASEDEETLDAIVRELELNIEILVETGQNLETVLNQVAAEIFGAIAADPTLGLAYVHDCELIGEDEPQLEAETETPLGRMYSRWRVFYEHSETSAEG